MSQISRPFKNNGGSAIMLLFFGAASCMFLMHKGTSKFIGEASVGGSPPHRPVPTEIEQADDLMPWRGMDTVPYVTLENKSKRSFDIRNNGDHDLTDYYGTHKLSNQSFLMVLTAADQFLIMTGDKKCLGWHPDQNQFVKSKCAASKAQYFDIYVETHVGKRGQAPKGNDDDSDNKEFRDYLNSAGTQHQKKTAQPSNGGRGRKPAKSPVTNGDNGGDCVPPFCDDTNTGEKWPPIHRSPNTKYKIIIEPRNTGNTTDGKVYRTRKMPANTTIPNDEGYNPAPENNVATCEPEEYKPPVEAKPAKKRKVRKVRRVQPKKTRKVKRVKKAKKAQPKKSYVIVEGSESTVSASTDTSAVSEILVDDTTAGDSTISTDSSYLSPWNS